MGIAVPRPAMRQRERRRIESNLRRHNEIAQELIAQGWEREAAHKAALHRLIKENGRKAMKDMAENG